MSLIEMLVGIAIGMIVVVAALISLAHTRTSASTLDSSVALHQNAALVWRTLGFQIRQAGAIPLLQSSTSANVVFEPTCLPSDPMCSVTPLSGVDGASRATDTLSVMFRREGALATSDCLGDISSNDVITSAFSVVDGELRCSDGSRIAPLVAGVEDFQVRYVQRTATGLQLVDSTANFNSISAVQVCLQLVGESQQEVPGTFENCNGTSTAPKDGRLHRVFNRVFNLRNAQP